MLNFLLKFLLLTVFFLPRLFSNTGGGYYFTLSGIDSTICRLKKSVIFENYPTENLRSELIRSHSIDEIRVYRSQNNNDEYISFRGSVQSHADGGSFEFTKGMLGAGPTEIVQYPGGEVIASDCPVSFLYIDSDQKECVKGFKTTCRYLCGDAFQSDKCQEAKSW